MAMPAATRIGTAGWSIPRGMAAEFGGEGTHLQRYARRLAGVEINSSFYRPHAVGTYARWAATTPDDFRFAVKVPRLITHDERLRRARRPLEQFLAETSGLGDKRGPLLVQLPPSLALDRRVAHRFFTLFRALYHGAIVCEPRHPTWFEPAGTDLLVAHRVARVAADPAVTPDAARPGGWPGLVYYRMHGSPRMYWSRYENDVLAPLSSALASTSPDVEAWCVFDNTAMGAALENAWVLQQAMTA